MSESHPSWISTIRVPDFSSPEEEGFVRSQPDPSRVSKETWTKLQEVVGSALSDSSEVIAALVFLTIRGMGKLPFITDAVGQPPSNCSATG